MSIEESTEKQVEPHPNRYRRTSEVRDNFFELLDLLANGGIANLEEGPIYEHDRPDTCLAARWWQERDFQTLISAGLIETLDYEGRQWYALTPKGVEHFKTYLQHAMQAFPARAESSENQMEERAK